MPARRRVAQIVVVLHAALLLSQPVTAGGLLDGDDGARGTHQATGGFLVLSGLVQLVVVAVAGRTVGTLLAIPLAAAIWVAEIAQMALGNAGVVRVHVPLGVATVVAAAGLVVLVLGRRARSCG